MLSHRASRYVLIALASIAFVAKIDIAYHTYGTNDAITFERDIKKLNTDGPERLYREGVETVGRNPRSPFSHSPSIIHLLKILQWWESKTGLPVRFWIRFLGSIADLCSLALVWMIGVRSTVALAVMALSPVSLMISGFNVNTDPIVICFVLLCVWLAISGRASLAGIALGGALAVKVLAVIFVPVLLRRFGWRQSLILLGSAGACMFVLSLPFAVQFPGVILHSIASYSGQVGFWGIPAVFLLIGANGFLGWYAFIGKYIALSVVLIVAFAAHKPSTPKDVLTQLGLAACLFLIFTPGFGVGYFVYLVPWLCLSRISVAICFYGASGAFMFAKYTAGSGGFPWYLCNLLGFHTIPKHEFFLELAAWLALILVCAELLHRSRDKTVASTRLMLDISHRRAVAKRPIA